MLDAVLLVMAEVVTYEVSPGRRRSMPRSEALVRELGDRAAYDPRSFKQLAEMYARAQYLQGQLREAEERAEELRLQRELDAEMRRRREEAREEAARREKRRQQALRRRERRAQAAADEVAAVQPEEREAIALTGEVGVAGDALAGGEGAPQAAADLVGDIEDARLYEVSYPRTWRSARDTPATAPPEPVEPPDVAAGTAWAPRLAATRTHRGPLIPPVSPVAGHGFGVGGGAGPPLPPPKFS
jgi:hypothetical protein